MKQFLMVIFFSICVNMSASAETVFVKYRGPVNIDSFACHNTVSSFVNRICYLRKNKYVIVKLKNTYYHYCRVPQNLVRQWLNSSSKGRFYNAYVKGNYDCRLGGVPGN